MRYLLDVNVLLVGIWENHTRHWEIFNWFEGKELVVCPLSELGFLRISANPKAPNADMDEARRLLDRFLTERVVSRVPDDLPPLQANAKSFEDITDMYLAELAARHGLKLATLDTRIRHALPI